MLILYAITLFLSAWLLFLVQPLFAKMVLPLLGGTPAVWNTCMVFFQAALVAGYAYAHLSTRLLGVRKQALLHAAVMLVPLLLLPLAVPEKWRSPAQGNPIGSSGGFGAVVDYPLGVSVKRGLQLCVDGQDVTAGAPMSVTTVVHGFFVADK